MTQCLALQRAFDLANIATAEARINESAAYLEGVIPAASFADVNTGQFAALIDFVIWKGPPAYVASPVSGWVANGNLTLPPYELAAYGKRGLAERDMWNLGNSE